MTEYEYIKEYKNIKNEYDLYEFDKIDDSLRKLLNRGKISSNFRNRILMEIIKEITE